MTQPLPSQISCLLIPVEGNNLLLPNASVAEVVDYQNPEPTHDTPAWFLGFIRWRGLRLPLISYEGANGSNNNEISPRARIAVTNTIGEHPSPLAFMAIVTQGIPRLMKVSKEEIAEAESAVPGPADKAVVRVSGEDAIIPELTHLEKLAIEAMENF
jgi:chemosensory pili system protein ChpC